MRLLLVRHGETIENASALMQGQQQGSLTERGKAQATALAQQLQRETIDAAFCSDLKRAMDTMSAIKAHHPRLTVQFCEELRERKLGIYEGRHGELYHQHLMASGLARADFRPTDGETIREVAARTVKFLERIRPLHADETILFCTHGGVITTLAAHLLDTPLAEMLEHPFQNASITELQLSGSQVRLVQFNSVEHLRDAALECSTNRRKSSPEPR